MAGKRRNVKKWGAIVCSMAACALLAGCISEGKEPRKIKKLGAPPANARINDVHLWSMPMALNLDARPGVDGFSVKIYASGPDYPKPIPIRAGTLEILMFDGSGEGLEEKPLRTWSFTPEQLIQYGVASPIGMGYEFTLPWEKNAPTKNAITVAARYTDASGNVFMSAPASITVVDKLAK